LLHKIEPTWSVAQPDLSPQMSDLVSFPWVRATYELVQGAPRPMKRGTTRSRFPYDAAARHALQSARLRYPTTLHYASRALPSILGGSSASITALSINPGTDVMGTSRKCDAYSRSSGRASHREWRG
jgi:hypothetical protein